jgi:hypothetical protein
MRMGSVNEADQRQISGLIRRPVEIDQAKLEVERIGVLTA